MSYLHSDYAKINFTTDEGNYKIGTNIAHLFTSEETTLLTTVDCLVKFNDGGLWQKVYGNDYFVFKSHINEITFKGESTNGTLEIWAEGEQIDDSQITELQNQLTETQKQITGVQTQITNIEKHHVLRRKIEGSYINYYDGQTLMMKYKMVKDKDGNIIELIPEEI